MAERVGFGRPCRAEAEAWRQERSPEPPSTETQSVEGNGGEGGIRTHVPVTRQTAFEAVPLRPLRYLSAEALPLATGRPQGMRCRSIRVLLVRRSFSRGGLAPARRPPRL